MWRSLQHPNVLPLVGVTMSETQFTMISDWMANGNINDFAKAHPDTNRLELVGCSLEVPSLRFKLIDNWTTYLAGGRRQGVDLRP